MLKKMLKRVGTRTQACFMPLEMGKGSDRLLLSLIWLHWSSCSWITIFCNLGDSQGAGGSARGLSCWWCQRSWLSLQTQHAVLSFVCGTFLVIARGWTPCPLCLCLLWSHTGFWEIFFGNGWYKPVEQDCGEDFFGDGQKGDPLIVFISLTSLPCSCTEWWWLCCGGLEGACPVPSRWLVHEACCSVWVHYWA